MMHNHGRVLQAKVNMSTHIHIQVYTNIYVYLGMHIHIGIHTYDHSRPALIIGEQLRFTTYRGKHWSMKIE